MYFKFPILLQLMLCGLFVYHRRVVFEGVLQRQCGDTTQYCQRASPVWLRLVTPDAMRAVFHFGREGIITVRVDNKEVQCAGRKSRGNDKSSNERV